VIYISKSLKELKSKDFWLEFFDKFSICDYDKANSIDLVQMDEAAKSELRDWMLNDGYYQLKNNKHDIAIDAYAKLVKKLVEHQILPVFGFVYDEFWILQARIKNYVEAILGPGYKLRPCFWSWHLDPKKEEAGWKIHRDGNIETIKPDGSTSALSVWVALSEANPLNGCMYLVPMNRESVKPQEAGSKLDFDMSSIRALPAEAGDIFFWNHWVIHWGAKSSKRAKAARMSIAFELEEAGSNILGAPLLDPMHLPSFDDRLRMIAYQIRQYTHMYGFSKDLLNFADSILTAKSTLA
jgi:hypothetical protein